MYFEPTSLKHLPRVRELLREDPQEAAEYSFGYQLFDRAECGERFGEAAGCGVFRWTYGGDFRYSFPFGGGDHGEAAAELAACCRKVGAPLVFSGVTALQADRLAEWFPDSAPRRELPEIADYICRTRDLADLSGRKYQDKRRLANRFTSSGNWRFEPVTTAEIDACRAVFEAWTEGKRTAGVPMTAGSALEALTLSSALDHFGEMAFSGGVLYRGDRPVAFALGEPITSEMMLASFEKAVPDVDGAFETVNREFARNCCAGYEWINRSWDEGVPGLRHAKRLYHPVRMLRKFEVAVLP